MILSENFRVEYTGNDTVITGACFDAALCLDCGQAFRWKCDEQGVWHGVAHKKLLEVYQDGDSVVLKNTDKSDFEKIWSGYFDLERDYKTLCESFCKDESLSNAVGFCPGIRVLRQEPWEALCSFIISQNNNIPRIKGIIERLCELLGDEIGEGIYSFPEPQAIVNTGVEGLAPIRAGFRAKYIYDAACKVVNGEIDFEKIAALDLEQAQQELMKIKGVGPKVASCVLLYGFARSDSFPVDVWVKRIMQELYPDGLPECVKGNEGIAQQYLFHWRRTAF